MKVAIRIPMEPVAVFDLEQRFSIVDKARQGRGCGGGCPGKCAIE
jgi:hypothetical protein